MKSLGIVRKIDELGRFVIPKELHKSLNMEKKQALEVFVDGENIVLRKYKSNVTVGDKIRNMSDLELATMIYEKAPVVADRFELPCDNCKQASKKQCIKCYCSVLGSVE